MRRLLLVSSSKTHGTGFLEHCAQAIQNHLSNVQRVLFVPFALANRDQYAEVAGKAFAAFGFKLESLHRSADPRLSIEQAESIFVGGGNTFRLLRHLDSIDALPNIRARVSDGCAYIGSSAGTNLACPTIRTTNDMPIVQPTSFEALRLIPFQINPHYIDADPKSKHQGETRATRLKEYLEENDVPVLGIREGSWLSVRDQACELCGSTGGVLFEQGKPPVEISANSNLDHLLQQ